MNKRKSFNLRVQKVEPESRQASVLNFVNSGELMPVSRLLSWTLEMCWLPWAYEYSQKEQVEPETLKRMARDAVYKLEMHLNYIRETFGLEHPDPLRNGVTTVEPLNGSTEEKPSLAPSPELEEELPGEYDLDSLGFNDEQQLSSERFKSGAETASSSIGEA